MAESEKRWERVKNALERTVSYYDAVKIACVSPNTIVNYAKKLGFPNSYELKAMWKYFNTEISYMHYTDYVLNKLNELGEKKKSGVFECPLDNFRTHFLEGAIRHVMINHSYLWNRIEEDLFKRTRNYRRCIMLAQSPKKYTKDDFLFEAIERSSDPNSIFSDEDFIIKLFSKISLKIPPK